MADARDGLVERLEAATEGGRELDWLICNVVGSPASFNLGPPPYTTSLDAALTLVPEGWAWMVGCAPGEGFFATLQTIGDDRPYAAVDNVVAATPALALCVAALHARQTEDRG